MVDFTIENNNSKKLTDFDKELKNVINEDKNKLKVKKVRVDELLIPHIRRGLKNIITVIQMSLALKPDPLLQSKLIKITEKIEDVLEVCKDE